MIKHLILWLLADTLNELRDELAETAETRQMQLNKSLILSFNTIKERIGHLETTVLDIADAVSRLEQSTNDELSLISGAHEHLDDIVQGICDELNKDHETLGVLFNDVMVTLDDLECRIEELEG